MRLYAAREGWITAKAMATFDEIRADLASLPEIEPAERANCHALAHAFAATRHDVEVVDGHFHSRNTYHSWLTIGSVVIDVAPVGGASPFIVDTEGMLNPWSRLYIPDEQVSGKVDREAAEQIASMLKAVRS